MDPKKADTVNFTVNGEQKETMEELDKEVKAMVEQGVDGLWQCKNCSTEFTEKWYAKRHAERHINHLKFKCGICNETFKTRDLLGFHRNNHFTDVVSIERPGRTRPQWFQNPVNMDEECSTKVM